MAVPRVSLIYRSEPSDSEEDQGRESIAKFPSSGWLCCAPFLLSTAALALSFVASGTCNLVTLQNSDYFPLPARSVGLWCYTTFGGSTYSTVNAPFDGKFDAARGCATATLILGIVVWLFYCFAACCPFTLVIFRIVGVLCLLNTIFQSLVFLVLRSDICWDGCGLDTASYYAIGATILWFLAGTMSCITGKPIEEEEEDDDDIPPQDNEQAERDYDSYSYSDEGGSGEHFSDQEEEYSSQDESIEERSPDDNESSGGEEAGEETKE